MHPVSTFPRPITSATTIKEIRMFFSYALALAVSAAADTGAEVTIYNQGFALVKETRDLNLKSGRQEVRIEDVAQLIEPSSVGIRSISSPGSFEVLEQNYQYDLISTQAILNKAVGGRIALNRVLPNGVKERITGILMSSPTAIVGGGGGQYVYNGLVLQADDGRILLDPSGEIEVTSIPEGLISKPSLLWDLVSDRAGQNKVEISYLTQGMSWNADYVLSLDGEGKTGDLKGWVTLNNNSGATFKEAKLKLLAGDVQRAQPRFGGGLGAGGRGGAPEAMMDKGFAEEQFADYHLYTLGRPASIRNKEIKQVSLLEATAVPVTKKLIIDAMRFYNNYQPQEEGTIGIGKIKPQIRIEFKNDKASNLGMPLPKGNFKVFQRDKSGSTQMLGEDQIDHTPRDEKLSLVVGQAFDVVCDRKRTKFEWLRRGGPTGWGTREWWEIELRNRKESPERVYVWERHWWEWAIKENNMPFNKLDANTIEFVVDLKAGETKTIKYLVETYWP